MSNWLFKCPNREEPASDSTNHYAWANPEHPAFKNGITDEIDPDTPIAGDAVKKAPGCTTDNHGENSRVNILLKDGSTQTAEPGTELWKKAYEEGMLKCPE